MKKWIVLLLAAVLLCTAACSVRRAEGTNAENTQSPAAVTEAPVPTEAPIEAPTEAPTEAPMPEPTPEPEPSCAEAIVGEWTIVSVEIGETTYDPATVGMDSSVVFYPNGAGMVTLTAANKTVTSVIVYTAEGNTITMIDETNETQTAFYDPEANEIRMSSDGVITVVLAPKGEAPAAEEEPENDEWKTAELETFTGDDGMEMVSITQLVPAGCTFTIDFPHQEDYSYTNDGDKATYRKVKIPVPVFYPNEPLTEAEAVIVPHVQLTFPDGTVHNVECPSFSVTFPTLELSVTIAHETNEDGAILLEANADGVAVLQGTVSEETAQISIDGTLYPVYMGGVFYIELAAGETETEYLLTAELNNYVSATLTVIVRR